MINPIFSHLYSKMSREKESSNDDLSIPDGKENNEMISCKACGHKVIKTKIIMHLSRSKKGCKKIYGKEFDDLKSEQDQRRKQYLTLKKKEQNQKMMKFRTKIHERISNSDADSDELAEDD